MNFALPDFSLGAALITFFNNLQDEFTVLPMIMKKFRKSSLIFISFFCRFVFFSAFVLILMPDKTAIAKDVIQITADKQYEYADHCFETKDYIGAAAEYKRCIYFFPDDPRTGTADFKIGMSYFYNQSYIEALKHFTQIFDQKGPTGSGISSAFMISRCYQKIRNLPAAIENLYYLKQITDDKKLHDKIFYHLGWLFIESGDFDRGHIAFSNISPENQTAYQIDDIQSDLAVIHKLPRKQPVLAGLLSIIPGGGYLYCGRYQDALTAFLINSALIVGAYESFDEELYAIGGMITVLGAGFYAGNIYGGVSSAYKFNQAQKNDFVRRLEKKFVPEAAPVLSMSIRPGGVGLAMTYHF